MEAPALAARGRSGNSGRRRNSEPLATTACETVNFVSVPNFHFCHGLLEPARPNPKRSLAMKHFLFGAFLLLTSSVLPQAAQDRWFDSNGVQIHYIEQGSGEPVLLIHGYTRSIETNWLQTGVFQNLAKDHHVIAFDLRGHGKSGKPHDPALY